MCKVCDKIDFAIETLESLFPEADLLDAFMDSFDITDPRKREEFSKEAPSAHGNFISILAIRYAIKKNLPPVAMLNLFVTIFEDEYGRETAARLFYSIFGKPPEDQHRIMNKKLKDYES